MFTKKQPGTPNKEKKAKRKRRRRKYFFWRII